VGTPVAQKSTTTHTSTQAAAPAKPQPPSMTPAMIGLSAAVTNTLNRAGPQTGAMVYDLTAHEPLFAMRANVGRPPASVEKLYTTTAVLKEMGPNARLRTTVVGQGHLGPGGVWHGNLYLVGGGDPTFGDGAFNKEYEQGYGPTANQLVGQLAHDGIHRVTGWVIGDAALFDDLRGGPATGYAPDIPDYGGQLSALTYDHGSTFKKLNPGAFAAKELVLTMNGAGIGARPLNRTLPAPAGSQLLASVSSPKISALLRLMDVPSDDLFADLLTKQLGVRFGGGGSITAGAGVISDTIASLGLHPQIVDGSGLSRDDHSSPGQVVDLLKVLWQTQTGRELAAALPTVGVNGTVQTIGTGTPAQGHCVAKTGTLNNVTNLAGYCTARDHHTLAFAVMIDGPANWAAYPMLSQVVGAVAKY
jgi:serine-type D-Ala-D-Ala carboxypeptidase/endopeptidase (penicillin-binding protein 4)